MTSADGGVFAFGAAAYFGSAANLQLQAPIVAIEVTATRKGYWLLASDGGIFAFGDAPFYGAAQERRFRRAVDLRRTEGGQGYWILFDDGSWQPIGNAGPNVEAVPSNPRGMFVALARTTRDAEGYKDLISVSARGAVHSQNSFRGDLRESSSKLAGPIVGADSPSGADGYWLAGADGGVFAFGNAPFAGSAAQIPLNAPVTGIAATDSGRGYYLAAEDGGVFSFGDAGFRGSAAGFTLNQPIVDIAVC